jgi:hypothetical protein
MIDASSDLWPLLPTLQEEERTTSKAEAEEKQRKKEG